MLCEFHQRERQTEGRVHCLRVLGWGGRDLEIEWMQDILNSEEATVEQW